MKRRTLLRTGAAAGAATLAGCLAAGGPGDGDGTGDGNATDDGTGPGDGNATGGPADGAEPTLGDVSFEVLDAGCGVETNAVSITTDEAAGEVIVEGAIFAPSACYTASLAEAVYGAETDSVWVDVVTERRPDAAACAQCLTEIRYRVTLPFEGGLPGRVAVTHDGELVCPGGAKPTEGGSPNGSG